MHLCHEIAESQLFTQNHFLIDSDALQYQVSRSMMWAVAISG